jgi:ATP-binding cassette subfamily B protein
MHKAHTQFSRVRKFLSYYRPYRRLFLADMACAFIVAATTLALPLCARHITQNLLSADIANALIHIAAVGGAMLLLVALQAICTLFVDYQGHMMGALMESDMRRDLFDHLQTLSFSFYDEQKTGQLMSRLTNDLFSLSEFYHHGPEDLAIAVLKFGGAFIIMLSINVPLTLIIFMFLPIMAAYAFYFNRRMNAALMQSKARIGDVNAQAEDTLAGIRVVKSFANEAVERAKFAHANWRFVESRKAGYRSEAYFSGGMGAFTQLFTIAVVIFGSISIVNGTADLPDLLTFLLYVGSLTEPIQRAVNFARLYQEGVTGFKRFMEVIETQPEIQDAPNAIDLAHVEGHIEFRKVTFRYQRNHHNVINDLSLSIGAGEYVALVGSSGAGKTTLCSLIPRFYEIISGQILLDGVDIRTIRLASLRRSIGIVQQDVYLFAGTVSDNIRYGKPSAHQDELIAAAQHANAHDFIMALPNGYETDIGQRGVKLSGGQKQRLSIARVFLKNPPIIIFDEATSALDNESEHAIRNAMALLTAQRTTLVIAHRLSTVRNAQRIIVLAEHGITEQGTHHELITRDGVYAKMYNLQLSF